jgi:hypothetical protein
MVMSNKAKFTNLPTYSLLTHLLLTWLQRIIISSGAWSRSCNLSLSLSLSLRLGLGLSLSLSLRLRLRLRLSRALWQGGRSRRGGAVAGGRLV